MKRRLFLPLLTLVLASLALSVGRDVAAQGGGHRPSFEVWEKTIPELQAALEAGNVTSRELVELYTDRIEAYDQAGPRLNSIRDLNRRARQIAHRLDQDRRHGRGGGPLFGIPIVLKDNIATEDQPTTAGSLALEGAVPIDDAFITKKLREAGAVILAKANLTEFANFLTNGMPAGYSSLGDFSFNPYDPRPDPNQPDGRPILSPGGSSSGPAIVAAASLAAAAIGTETSGSILSPGTQNLLVGIKPTVGLASRTGIIPIASAQDTAGPLARTVTDAAIVLGAMTPADPDDPATLVPERVVYSDYTQFLDPDALRGARIGIAFGLNAAGQRTRFYFSLNDAQRAVVDAAAQAMRDLGAEVFLVEITTAQQLADHNSRVLRYEFKRDLNAYLSRFLRPRFPIRTLADVVAFNDAYQAAHPEQNRFRYPLGGTDGQILARASAATDLEAERDAYLSDLALDRSLSRTGIDGALQAHNLDALLFGANNGANIGARANYPSIVVPAGFLSTGAPYGVTFCGTAWSESRLIALAYAFEQGTRLRRPPASTPPIQ